MKNYLIQPPEINTIKISIINIKVLITPHLLNELPIDNIKDKIILIINNIVIIIDFTKIFNKDKTNSILEITNININIKINNPISIITKIIKIPVAIIPLMIFMVNTKGHRLKIMSQGIKFIKK